MDEIMKKFYINYFKKYDDIIQELYLIKDIDGNSRVVQKVIANKLSISQSLVSKCIIRLERSDKCIGKVIRGIYKVNHTNLIKYGPFNKFIKYCVAINNYSNFLRLSDKEKIAILNIDYEELKMVRGYFQQFESYIII